MTKEHTSEEIKYRLSDLGVQIGNIAIEYITELEEKLEQTEKDLADYQFNYPTIKELEKENAELDCQKNRNKFCYSCVNATERCFRNEIGCPCENYKSYKDENTELKEENNRLTDTVMNLRCKVSEANSNAVIWTEELVAENKYLTKQLTKAKEMLLRFIELKNKPCAVGNSVNMLLYDNICTEVKQFLKDGEVEK